MLRLFLTITIFITVQIYFYKRFQYYLLNIKPEKTSFIKKALKSIIILLNLYPSFLIFNLIIRSFGIIERFYIPKNAFLDYLMIYPFWIIFILLVQITPYFLLSEIFKSVFKNKIKTISVIIVCIVGFHTIYIPFRMIYDDNNIRVINYKVNIDHLTKDLIGKKIILISDLQADYYTNREQLNDYTKLVNAQEADLIFIAGDFITNTNKYIKLAGETAGQLEAKYGVYAAPGDHDHWAYGNRKTLHKKSLDEITQSLDDNGVDIFVNKNHYIYIDSAKILLTVSNHTYSSKIDSNQLKGLLTPPKENVDLKIFLNHQPAESLIKAAEKSSYHLFLAGHTHGGQVNFMFPFFLFRPSQIETPYINGMYSLGSLNIFVTAGLGVSIAPIRYNAVPNLLVIELNENQKNIELSSKN